MLRKMFNNFLRIIFLMLSALHFQPKMKISLFFPLFFCSFLMVAAWVLQLTIADITDEMEKTLHWLSPMATNTSK